jgi:solute carrier family 35 protein F1/2
MKMKLSTRSTFSAVLSGQGLAILMATATIFSGRMEHAGFPTFQAFPVYLILSFGLILHARKSRLHHTHRPIWLYALMAALDVEANFLIVTAIQSAAISMTSVQTLNSATVPFSVFLSFVILRRKYSIKSLLAVACTLLGLGLIIYCNGSADGNLTSSSHSAIMASLLCLGSALLYASCNVLEEISAKADPPSRSLGMLGAFGSIISGVQGIVLEGQAILDVSRSVVLPWIGFVVTLASFYVCLMQFLARYDAASHRGCMA